MCAVPLLRPEEMDLLDRRGVQDERGCLKHPDDGELAAPSFGASEVLGNVLFEE